MDRDVINSFFSEVSEETYNKFYTKAITNRQFFSEADKGFAVKENEEGEVEVEGNVANEVGDENVTVVGKIAIKLIDLVEEKLEKVKIIEITESNGDITKLKFYDELESIASIVTGLKETQDMDSEFVTIYLDLLEFTKGAKKNYRKAFKAGNKNLLAMMYITSVLYLVEMASILSSALLKWVDTGNDIDKTISKRDEFVEIFEKSQGILEDDDLNKFMNVDFSKSLISESNISGDMLVMYSETSINDTIRLFKLGLAKFLHKISGFFRFIIYLYYNAKFTIQQKIQKVDSVIKLYETENKEERKQELREAKKLDKDMKIDGINAASQAEKQYQEEKIEIEDTEGFAL